MYTSLQKPSNPKDYFGEGFQKDEVSVGGLISFCVDVRLTRIKNAVFKNADSSGRVLN